MSAGPAARTIVVGVDFSDSSESALAWAAAEARAHGCRLLVLHVVHDPADSPGRYLSLARLLGGRVPQDGERAEETAARLMEAFLDRARGRLPDLAAAAEVATRIVKGVPGPRIAEVAAAERARQVVLGSRGLGGLRHALLGSTAARVVRLAELPVTVVKTSRTAAPDAEDAGGSGAPA